MKRNSLFPVSALARTFIGPAWLAVSGILVTSWIATPARAESNAISLSDTITLKVGGALRFNYVLRSDNEDNKNRFGDLAFDIFRIKVEGTCGPLRLSSKYRFHQGYHMLEHGYIGYVFPDWAEIDVGVSQVPFGILKYASHSWFFNAPFYLGLEEDYDLGIRGKFHLDDLEFAFAFYKNSEASYTGTSIASARYSYDVVAASVAELGGAGLQRNRNNSESNQGNIRLAYTLAHGDSNTTEFGISGQFGGLYNSETEKTGVHWAAAAHINGNYGPVNLQLQGIRYGHRPENPEDDNQPDIIVMGAFDAPYLVSTYGTLFNANIAYHWDVGDGLINAITFYNDFSILLKDPKEFENTISNIIGASVAAGELYTYIDLVIAKNHPFAGPNYGSTLAAGLEQDGGLPPFEARFNINFGYYF